MLLGFGLIGRIWVRLGPKDNEALRMGWGGRGADRWTDVRTVRRTDGWTVHSDYFQKWLKNKNKNRLRRSAGDERGVVVDGDLE